MNRNQKSFHYIYITTNNISGMKYVGQHSTDNLNDNYIGTGRKFIESIKKHGKQNFRKEILEYGNSADELDELEIKYIKSNNTLYPGGYNMTSGGESKKEYSKESLCIMSEKAKGRKISEETRIKMSKASRGRVFSAESRKKRSLKLKGRVFQMNQNPK